MNKRYYYLALNGSYEIIVAQEDSDRVGLLGVTFTATKRVSDYVEQLNREAEAKADNEAATD